MSRDPSAMPAPIRLVFEINGASFPLFIAFSIGFLAADSVSDRLLTRIGFPWNQLSWFLAVSAIVRLASRWAFPSVPNESSDTSFEGRWVRRAGAVVAAVRRAAGAAARVTCVGYRFLAAVCRTCVRRGSEAMHIFGRVGRGGVQVMMGAATTAMRISVALRCEILRWCMDRWMATRRFFVSVTPAAIPLLDGAERTVRRAYAVVDMVVVAIGFVTAAGVSIIAVVLWSACRSAVGATVTVGGTVVSGMRETLAVVAQHALMGARVVIVGCVLVGITVAAIAGDALRSTTHAVDRFARHVVRRTIDHVMWCVDRLHARGWVQLLHDAFVIVLLWYLLSVCATIAVPASAWQAYSPSVPLAAVVVLGVLACAARSARVAGPSPVGAFPTDARSRQTLHLVRGGAIAGAVVVAWTTGAATVPIVGVIVGGIVGCLTHAFTMLWLAEDAGRPAEGAASVRVDGRVFFPEDRAVLAGASTRTSWERSR